MHTSVDPTNTISIEGTSTNMPREPPSTIAKITMAKPPINPTRVAKSKPRVPHIIILAKHESRYKNRFNEITTVGILSFLKINASARTVYLTQLLMHLSSV